MRSLSLGNTYVCEVCINPSAVFIAVQEGPVLLWSGLALYIAWIRGVTVERTSQALVPYLRSARLCTPSPCRPRKSTLYLVSGPAVSLRCVMCWAKRCHCDAFWESAGSLSYFLGINPKLVDDLVVLLVLAVLDINRLPRGLGAYIVKRVWVGGRLILEKIARYSAELERGWLP